MDVCAHVHTHMHICTLIHMSTEVYSWRMRKHRGHWNLLDVSKIVPCVVDSSWYPLYEIFLGSLKIKPHKFLRWIRFIIKSNVKMSSLFCLTWGHDKVVGVLHKALADARDIMVSLSAWCKCFLSSSIVFEEFVEAGKKRSSIYTRQMCHVCYERA